MAVCTDLFRTQSCLELYSVSFPRAYHRLSSSLIVEFEDAFKRAVALTDSDSHTQRCDWTRHSGSKWDPKEGRRQASLERSLSFSSRPCQELPNRFHGSEHKPFHEERL